MTVQDDERPLLNSNTGKPTNVPRVLIDEVFSVSNGGSRTQIEMETPVILLKLKILPFFFLGLMIAAIVGAAGLPGWSGHQVPTGVVIYIWCLAVFFFVWFLAAMYFKLYRYGHVRYTELNSENIDHFLREMNDWVATWPQVQTVREALMAADANVQHEVVVWMAPYENRKQTKAAYFGTNPHWVQKHYFKFEK